MFLQLLICIIITLLIVDYLWRRKTNKLLKNISGPPILPIIGSILMFIDTKPDELLKLANSITQKYGRNVKFWIFHIKALFISDAKFIQALLSHPTEIRKNRMYSLLDQWLGDGLLLSHGPKWLARRRAITPAFHFKILDNFIPIFDQQAAIFAAKLCRHSVEKSVMSLDDIAAVNDQEQYIIDIEHYIALATLDVICETAMSVKINAQTNEECEYVQNLIEMQHIFLQRFVAMTYRSNILFKFLNPKLYARYNKVMKALHTFTEDIIRERRIEIQKDQQKKSSKDTEASGDNGEEPNEANVYTSSKKRLALLDILLSSRIDGLPLTDDDIREEVDTFMFEGHDTTKSGIGFTLYALSREQAVQSKLYAEVKEVVGLDVSQPLTYTILMDLKYMDKVIKESLRMYPPVPFYGRQTMQDIYIDDQCIPGGTSIIMGIMTMQNDPLYFDEPQRFLPEREIGVDKGFVFLPFSAGPRNCIGQRFAMLEMKAFLVRVLQQYHLLPWGEDIQPTISVVLKSKTGWQMGLRRRQ